MKKFTLSMLLQEYSLYRAEKNEAEDKTKATNVETCRQKLGEVMKVMGIDPTLFKALFKDPSDERSYRFSEEDKFLIFELLDRHSRPDFKLMRKGKFHKVPVNSLRFYLKSFLTLFNNLQVDPEVIRDQKEKMILHTRYTLVVELHNINQLMAGIKQDINQIIEEVTESDNTRYLDSIALLRDLATQLHSLRERNRFVFYFMDSKREHEVLSKEVETLKQNPIEERERIKKLAQLTQVLINNEKYMDLMEKSEELEGEIRFSTKKRNAYFKILKEMNEIFTETQIQKFGEVVEPSSIDEDSEMSRIPSEEVLDYAVETYQGILFLLSNESERDDVPMAVEMVAQRFGDETNNGNRRVLSIYKIVLATHLELDWEDLVSDAYDDYLKLSELEQKKFDRLIKEAAVEYEELFLSYPSMYQTNLELDIRNDIQGQIIAKLVEKFESFL